MIYERLYICENVINVISRIYTSYTNIFAQTVCKLWTSFFRLSDPLQNQTFSNETKPLHVYI